MTYSRLFTLDNQLNSIDARIKRFKILGKDEVMENLINSVEAYTKLKGGTAEECEIKDAKEDEIRFELKRLGGEIEACFSILKKDPRGKYEDESLLDKAQNMMKSLQRMSLHAYESERLLLDLPMVNTMLDSIVLEVKEEIAAAYEKADAKSAPRLA